MKLSFSNALLEAYDKDMGDCVIHIVHGKARVVSDVDIRSMVDFGLVNDVIQDTVLDTLLKKALPGSHKGYPALIRVANVSEDGKSFTVSWKWGYGDHDANDRSIEIAAVEG